MDDNVVFIRDVNGFPKFGKSMKNPSKHGSTHHAVFIRKVRDNIIIHLDTKKSEGI